MIRFKTIMEQFNILEYSRKLRFNMQLAARQGFTKPETNALIEKFVKRIHGSKKESNSINQTIINTGRY